MPVTQLYPTAMIPVLVSKAETPAGDEVLKHMSLQGYFNTQIITTSELGGGRLIGRLETGHLTILIWTLQDFTCVCLYAKL